MDELLSDAAGNRKRIAVIAVHGVGDHEPFATSREIGNLLSNLDYNPDPHRASRYAPFTESMKRIHVRPVITDKTGDFDWTDVKLQKNTWGPMHALARAVFHRNSKPPAAPAGQSQPPDTLDYLFMKGQLVDYSGERPEDTYQCLRLEGMRVPPVSEPGKPPPTPSPDSAGSIAEALHEGHVDIPETSQAAPGQEAKSVHIYEMYWADLSRLSNAFTRILGELYQLLFHLGAVSVNNVLAAAIHLHGKPGAKEWRSFAKIQGFSAAVFAWPIPILTLLMAAFTPAVLVLGLLHSQHVSAEAEFLGLDALITILLLAGVAYLLSHVSTLTRFYYLIPLPLAGGLAALAALWGSHWPEHRTDNVLAAVIVSLSLAAVALIIRAYERRRPGSLWAAMWIGGTFLVTVIGVAAFTWSFPVGPPLPNPAISICLNSLETAFGLLTLSWAVFFGSFGLAHFAGGRAVRAVRNKVPSNPEHVKARRARWTAQLVLALSSVVFITLTLTLWTGIVKVGKTLFPAQDLAPIKYEPLGAVLYDLLWKRCPSAIQHLEAAQVTEGVAARYLAELPTVPAWADQILTISGIGLLPIFLVALGAAGLSAAWALFPSVVDELSPPGSEHKPSLKNESKSPSDRLQQQSIAQGIWLTRGFSLMRAGGNILYWTMWLPPLLFVLFNVEFVSKINKHQDVMTSFTKVISSLVAGTAIGIFGLGGRFKSFARTFRPLIRVMLDVDNWLREHPRDSNPTARICGRYVSLMRYISAWRDPQDHKPYDALVIIAHSQGTVITSDFLRFLNTERRKAGSMGKYDPELAWLNDHPVYLFTMGCPLHQLYGLRFPHLYAWARNDGAIESAGTIPDIGEYDAPNPEGLNVKRWVNAYRSGDYVGRYLWRGGVKSYDWHPAKTSYDGVWDPPAGQPEKVSSDQAGKRIEFSIGPGAHTHYWDNTAALIAEVLDRLINNA